MELDLLKTLVIVGESETRAEAAQRIGVTPSAVSQQLKVLEAQFGAPLFERVGRRSVPTAAALELMQLLREPFAKIDRTVALAQRDFHEVRGPLSIGGPRSFAGVYLRPRLISLLHDYPELELELVFDVPSALRASLVRGELDLAILVDANTDPGVSTIRVAEETFVCVGAPAYLERCGRPRTLEDFLAQRYVIFDHDQAMHGPWWRASFGAKAPAEVAVACRVASLPEMLALAEAGVGLTVLPDYMLAGALADGRLEALVPATSLRPALNPIDLGWRRGALESARFRKVRELLSTPWAG
ncbi:MAG: LysR family transcriptional regulator [Nannocystaceae bacterium]